MKRKAAEHTDAAAFCHPDTEKERKNMPIFDRDHAESPENAYTYILRCADGTLY